MKPTVDLYLDCRRLKKNNKYPVKIRLTYLRRSRYFSTHISLNKVEWQQINTEKTPRRLKSVKDDLIKALHEIKELIQDKVSFNLDTFNPTYNSANQSLFLKDLFENKINKLFSENRIRTAETFQNSFKSISNFKNNLQLTDITPDWLESYENHFIQILNRSETSLSIYLRALRTIYNDAIESGIIDREIYPFGRRKYIIPAGNKRIKDVLSVSEISAFINYKTIPGSKEDRFKLYWLFMYLTAGCNAIDLALLKYENISNNVIHFHRKKTQRNTRQNRKTIKSELTPIHKKIIQRYGNKISNGYLFPILNNDLSESQIISRVRQLSKDINFNVQKVANAAGIKKPITSGWARHSFASNLLFHGVNLLEIRDSLGHSDLKTTEHYLNSFSDSIKNDWNKKLLNKNIKI